MSRCWQKAWVKVAVTSGILALLVGCNSRPTDRGQQYRDGEFNAALVPVAKPNLKGQLINGTDFTTQIVEIGSVSPNLYRGYSTTYHAVSEWLDAGADLSKLKQFGLNVHQMSGGDSYGNVKFTGYYTPVIDARSQPDAEFKYPLYALPKRTGKSPLPERAEIYAGVYSGQGLELAYSNSLIDTFLMEVQGSAYIDFADGSPLNFFSYAGKNGHPYKSIGKVLVERGEVPLDKMSMQAIRQWVSEHSEEEVIELLGQNPSFVFFLPKGPEPVKGGSGIPLIAKASVAADRALIAPGTTLLAEVPTLDETGQLTGKYELRLMVALDVGGAIKGHHFDIYQGIGKSAGELAGFYNHYGRVWVLSTPGDNMSQMLPAQ